MKGPVFKTTHLLLRSFPGEADAETGAALPGELRGFLPEADGGSFFRTVWQAVKRDSSAVFAWAWFDRLSPERRDVMLHLSFCEAQPEEALVTELCNELRFRAVSQKGVLYLYTPAKEGLLPALEACGFEPARLEGGQVIMEYAKRSGGRFLLYLLLAALLFLPAWLFFENPLSAACVSLCLSLGGGFVYDSIQRNHFAARRAALICAERDAAQHAEGKPAE
ncbi:MAG: hypothetical protein ACI3WR_01210 [Oscillospiraceae bacterium]